MPTTPTSVSQFVWKARNISEDFLQLRNPHNDILGWIDANGVRQGSLAGGGTPTSPANPITSLQYNNGGAFGGTNILWDAAQNGIVWSNSNGEIDLVLNSIGNASPSLYILSQSHTGNVIPIDVESDSWQAGPGLNARGISIGVGIWGVNATGDAFECSVGAGALGAGALGGIFGVISVPAPLSPGDVTARGDFIAVKTQVQFGQIAPAVANSGIGIYVTAPISSGQLPINMWGVRIEDQGALGSSATAAIQIDAQTAPGYAIKIDGGLLSTADQIESTLPIGLPPFIIASTTVVPNLNVEVLNGVTVTGTPAPGDALVASGAAAASWATLPGTGTVTSVGLSTDASWLTVGSSPVTGAGTITLNKTDSLTANYVLATPNGAPGKVGLRALVAADVPNLATSKLTSGQLALARGGTGSDLSATGPGFLKQASGGTVVTVATLGSSDIPNNAADTTGKSAKTDALNSATTVVNVSASAAPSTGDILTATDSTHATWQAPSGASGSSYVWHVNPFCNVVTGGIPSRGFDITQTVGEFSRWTPSRSITITEFCAFLSVAPTGGSQGNAVVQIYDVTAGTALESLTLVSGSGAYQTTGPISITTTDGHILSMRLTSIAYGSVGVLTSLAAIYN